MRRAAATALIALGLLAGLWPAPAPAQEATPPPGAEVPGPEECTVAPISPAEFLAVFATPAAAPASPAPGGPPAPGGELTVGSEADFPAGEPADPATAEAVAAAVRILLACVNADDRLRQFALFSDDLLRAIAIRAVAVPTEAELAAEAATPPVPLPVGERVAIVAIRDARVFPDGRAGVVAVIGDPGDEQDRLTGMYVFVEVDGRWLLDATVRIGEPEEE